MGVAAGPLHILFVEDNPGDVRLLQETLNQGSIRSRLSVARDGQEAILFLRRQSRFADAPRPALILLDLNLPKKDGREVLAEIKGDPDLKRIPVLVLTSSSADRDILRSYDLHANCYIIKPAGLDEFANTVRCLYDFWLTVATLPAGR